MFRRRELLGRPISHRCTMVVYKPERKYKMKLSRVADLLSVRHERSNYWKGPILVVPGSFRPLHLDVVACDWRVDAARAGSML